MDIQCFATLILGYLSAIIPQGHCAVKWDTSNLELTQGDNASITCTATLLDMFDIIRIFWTDEALDDIAITDGDGVKDWFQKSGRYRASASTQGDQSTVTLNYTGVLGEDAGRIGCSVLGQAEKAYVDLTVNVPVREVYLKSVSNNGDETRLVNYGNALLREGDDLGLVCEAASDAPNMAPEIKITAGDKDITSAFVRTQDNDVSVIPLGGLPKRGTSVRLVYRTAHPDPDYNNQQIMCTATLKAGAKTAAAQLQVEYSPVITCDAYDHMRLPGEQVTFTCELRANPGPHVTWLYADGEGEEREVSEMPPNATLHTSGPTPISSDRSRVELTIPSVMDDHFTRYILRAKNDFGEQQMDIILSKGTVEIIVPTEPPVVHLPVTTEADVMPETTSEEVLEKSTQKAVVQEKNTQDVNAQKSQQGNGSKSSHDVINMAALLIVTLNVIISRTFMT